MQREQLADPHAGAQRDEDHRAPLTFCGGDQPLRLVEDQRLGVTIVAIGTSLPELATSVIAALRVHGDLAVGNVVGSNIFNVLLILGASVLAGSIKTPISNLVVELRP